MVPILTVTEGWSETLPFFTLKVDGVAFSLQGFTVAVVLKDRTGALVPSGTLTVDPDQNTNKGRVYFKPADETFRQDLSPYTLHFKVTDGSGDDIFFPNGQASQIKVTKP